MKFSVAGIFIAHLLAFLLSGQAAQAQFTSIQTREVRGESLDGTNLDCEEPAKIATQREQAQDEFEERRRMRSGICAWHSGDYYSTEPQELIQSLGEGGCRIVVTALGTCYQ